MLTVASHAVAWSAAARHAVAWSATRPPTRLAMQEDALASLFEDKPPASWSSPEWQWGSAAGAAHEVAARVREDLNKPHRRSAFLTYAKADEPAVDLVDLKMALALACQRARNYGCDEPDRRWEALMEEMAACKYERMEEDATGKAVPTIDVTALAEAVNGRLPTPFGAAVLSERPVSVIAEGLVALDFVEKGC